MGRIYYIWVGYIIYMGRIYYIWVGYIIYG